MFNKAAFITLVAFGVHFLIDERFFRSIRAACNELLNQIGVSHIIAYTVVGLPIILGVIILHGYRNISEALGLNKGFLKALVFSLLCTLPMFVGNASFFSWNHDFTLNSLLITVIAAAFFEELYFRGFLFGQLYRYTSWGFIPSVIIGALLFGFVHLYQGTETAELAGIFLVTFLGSILYAWVYVEHDYNLWIPIFLHAFMNLAWGIFSAGDNALGGVYPNIFRAITIVLIIVITIIYKKKKGLLLKVHRGTMWMKRE